MTLEVRPGRPGEFEALARTVEAAFGDEARPDEVASWARRLGDRFYVALEDGSPVGGAADFPFRLTVPGGEVAAAGVTGVGVLPTHRRRGVLTSLMRLELATVRARGEPLAILWASEGAIYQRFGYGLASFVASIELARARSAFREPVTPEGRVRLVPLAAAAASAAPIFERVRRTRPGAWARNDAWWSHLLDDSERRRRGGGPLFAAIHERAGRADAYALYRIFADWRPSGPRSTLRIIEAVAEDPAATRELWRFLCDVDLVATVEARFEPIDHPLLLLLAEPRALQLTVGDGLWLRLVDVAAALTARGYAAADRLVLDLADRFVPSEAGRWALDTGGDRAVAARTEAPADLRLDTTDLAAAYLGGVSFRRLAAAGRVEPLTADALARADAQFASAAVPWSPLVF